MAQPSQNSERASIIVNIAQDCHELSRRGVITETTTGRRRMKMIRTEFPWIVEALLATPGMVERGKRKELRATLNKLNRISAENSWPLKRVDLFD